MAAPMDVRTASTDSVMMFDAEKYRKKYESRREWGLRKAFLEAHKDNFPEDRLLCLSHCFTNVEMYGCTYPGPVMAQLSALAESIQDKVNAHRQLVKSTTEVKFVKASGSDNIRSDISGPTTSSLSKSGPQPAVPPKYSLTKPKVPMMFVKSRIDFKSTDYQQDSSAEVHPPTLKTKFSSSMDESLSPGDSGSHSVKYKLLGKHILSISQPDMNSISTLHLAMDKLKMTAQTEFSQLSPLKGACNPSFSCTLQVDFVKIASGTGNSKKEAKQMAYTAAIEKLSARYMNIIGDGDSLELVTSSEPFVGDVQPSTNPISCNTLTASVPSVEKTRKRLHPAISADLSNFLILESVVGNNALNSMSVVRQSADFNKWSLDYEFMQCGDATRCQVFLNSILVVDCMGNSKTNAKSVASDMLLEILQASCWTVKVKKNEDSDELGVTRDELLGDVDRQNHVISESNVGNMLLKKMGWTGGGVGKEGREGRATPVTVDAVINRQGLGLQLEQGIARSFVHSIKSMLSEYARSARQEDVVFSPEFCNEERAIIHKEAHKLGLKSGSKGSGDERYLIIGRKRSAGQLFDHIVQHGGSTSKYELVPPGGHS